MSDPRSADHPVDQAYREAEALLSDEAARAARRARVLGAVADEGPATPSAPARRSAERPLRWLTAAGVAGFVLLVAIRSDLLRQPSPVPSPAPEPPKATSPPPANAPEPPSEAPAPLATPPARREPRPAAVNPPLAAAAPENPPASQPTPPVTLPPLPVPPVEHHIEEPRPPSAAPARAPGATSGTGSSSVQEIVVTGAKRHAADAPAERLRSAAADGRTAEIESLLADGVDVDARDASGDTALMKAVQANRPAAAALLRQHGASLTRRNKAGRSARDMAVAIGNTELNQALGIEP